MTTNGALLPQYAAELKQAGVDRLNISLDTLNEDKFASLTRGGSLADTLAGLDAAWNAGFRGTKLNAVLLGGVNADEIPALGSWRRTGNMRYALLNSCRSVSARTGRVSGFSADAVLHALPELQRLPNEGVAELYRMPGWKGKIGLIRPDEPPFLRRLRPHPRYRRRQAETVLALGAGRFAARSARRNL